MGNWDFLNSTEQTLLFLVSDALNGNARPLDTDKLDWTALKYEAYIQTVSVLAFAKINSEFCSEEELGSIRRFLQMQMSRNIAVNKAHVFLHSVMHSAQRQAACLLQSVFSSLRSQQSSAGISSVR